MKRILIYALWLLPAPLVLAYVFYTPAESRLTLYTLHQQFPQLSAPLVKDIDDMWEQINGAVELYKQKGVLKGVFYEAQDFSMQVFILGDAKAARQLYCHENARQCEREDRSLHPFGMNFHSAHHYVKIVASKKVDAAQKQLFDNIYDAMRGLQKD